MKNNNSIDRSKKLYIEEFLSNHKEYNITDSLLTRLTSKLQFPDSYDKLLFAHGTNEFLALISQYYDDLMLNILSQKPISTSITKRISIATSTRLKIPDKDLLVNLSRYYLSFSKTLYGTKLAFKTCDQIWHYAGDRSTDYNFYTKRALLLSVFLPSMFYYLGDNSIDHIDTDYFIDSSLEKIVKIASIKKQIKIPKLEDIPFIRMFV